MVEATEYGPIAVLLIVAISLAAIIYVLAHWIGPRRHGAVKESTYESGVAPIGDAHKRFNVRFYIIAMIFLLFDVEAFFIYAAVPHFRRAATEDPALAAFLAVELLVFLSILIVAWIYARQRGVFRWN
jgi:NADH:ubiquinone oxidoreductase subunit 3 (subunit A)